MIPVSIAMLLGFGLFGAQVVKESKQTQQAIAHSRITLRNKLQSVKLMYIRITLGNSSQKKGYLDDITDTHCVLDTSKPVYVSGIWVRPNTQVNPLNVETITLSSIQEVDYVFKDVPSISYTFTR